MDKASAAAIAKRMKTATRLVITSAQNATPVEEKFLSSLLMYCKHNKAQLLVIPHRYKNPTSRWSEEAQSDDWWDEKLTPYLFDRRVEINSNLVLLADIKTQPTATAPTLGMDTITGAKSAIIGHPKIELRTVAAPQSKMAKLLVTTGACTKKNYIPSKAGKKAEHHHSFGAVVVELSGKKFHLRQLSACNDGSFCDLDREYSGAKVKSGVRAEALVTGDMHVEHVDPAVVKATFEGPNSMLAVLKPKAVVYHDIFDGDSINPHAQDVFSRFSRHANGRKSVERELEECFAFIDKHTPPGVKAVFPYSNHPDFLRRYVRDTDPRGDLDNCVWLAGMFKEMCLAIKEGKELDPFEFEARTKLKCYARARFLKMDESCMIAGIEVGMHGHLGPSGTRGSAKAFSKIGVKSVTGHSHSPAIDGGAYVVGTTSRLRLSYNHGPSSWLHAHVAIYSNGKRSLIFVIDGDWRA